MSISERLRSAAVFSFEFFPPKDDAGSRQLFKSIEALAPLGRPSFQLPTGPAAARARAPRVAKEIQRGIGLTVVAHVTAWAPSRESCARFRRPRARGHRKRSGSAWRSAARYAFVAVAHGFRTPTNSSRCSSATTAFASARRVIRRSTSRRRRWKRLQGPGSQDRSRRRLFGITTLFRQLTLLCVRARLRARGITSPILPGLMPITNFAQIQRFVAMCGATIPPKLSVEMQARKDDVKAVEDLGVAYAAMQASELLQSGVPAFISIRSIVRPRPAPSYRRSSLRARGAGRRDNTAVTTR